MNPEEKDRLQSLQNKCAGLSVEDFGALLAGNAVATVVNILVQQLSDEGKTILFESLKAGYPEVWPKDGK